MNLLCPAPQLAAKSLWDGMTLIIETGVPVDDQFSFPKQCNYSTALGKVLICGSTTTNGIHLRNSDLSYFSKYNKSFNTFGVDANASNVFIGYSSALYKYSLDFTGNSYVNIPSLRMIDFASDPVYGYVSANNAAFHGVYMVEKSTMTIKAQLGGAAGSGNGQFSNPLGLKYRDGFLYVVDSGNGRIQKLVVTRTPGAEALTFDSNVITGWAADSLRDIATDGSFWYICHAANLYKYDMTWISTGLSIATNGYSLCIIPDQSDSNGATLCVVSNTNSNIKRHKCSDLSLITTVGSAGDGSVSLFDPTFTTSVNTHITYQFDDGFQYTTPLGTSHALSWNGFAGYSFRNAGPHRCVVKVEGGLGLITVSDVRTDAVTSINRYERLINEAAFYVHENSGLHINISKIPRSVTTYYATLGTVSDGNIADMPPGCLLFYATTGPVGNLSSVPAVIQYLQLFGLTTIVAGSIGHCTGARDFRIYSMGWAQAGVDLVIDSAWTARTSYTYMTGPSLQIGGTNAAPTGNYIAPVEGADWHNDGSKWIPLTGKAKIYDLVMNVNSEVRPVWMITYTA